MGESKTKKNKSNSKRKNTKIETKLNQTKTVTIPSANGKKRATLKTLLFNHFKPPKMQIKYRNFAHQKDTHEWRGRGRECANLRFVSRQNHTVKI